MRTDVEFTDYDKVIDYLARSRNAQNLSMVEVGKRMDRVHSIVWRIETKKRTPSFAMLRLYAEAIGHELVIDVREPLLPLRSVD